MDGFPAKKRTLVGDVLTFLNLKGYRERMWEDGGREGEASRCHRAGFCRIARRGPLNAGESDYVVPVKTKGVGGT